MELFKSISDGAAKASKNRKVITLFLVILLVYLIRKEIRKTLQTSEYNALSTSVNAQLAFQIRQACNPEGYAFGFPLIDVDGTDEEKLFVVASQINDWKGVQDSYFRLYGETLVSRLENELQGDFQKFIDSIPKAGSTTQPGTNTGTPPTNYLGYSVVSLAAMNLYYKDAPAKIAKTVQGGKTVGEWAGEQVINGVPYIIVRSDLLWWTDYYLARKSDVKIVKP